MKARVAKLPVLFCVRKLIREEEVAGFLREKPGTKREEKETAGLFT